MVRAIASLFALIALALPSIADAGDPPAATDPAARMPHKGRAEGEKLAYLSTWRPNLAEPGKVVAIELEISEKLAVPDPAFGSRKPINDAKVHAVLMAMPQESKPAKGKKRGKKKKTSSGPAWIEARKGLKLRDAGTYGFTFTPKKAGLYALFVRGTTPESGPVEFYDVVPVGVWPVPEEKSAENPISMPAKTPRPMPGDMAHGRAICESRCRTDVDGALPKGRTPTFIRSDVAAALDDDALFAKMVTDGPRLMTLEKSDLMYYLRSLHRRVDEFFPDAAMFLAHTFTVNEHGKKRLKETLKLDLADERGTATVFVAYQGEREGNRPRLIDYDDRITRDRLKRSDKLGYLVFLNIPKDPHAHELAIAMEREPVYSIRHITARDAKGRSDPSLNKQLKSFVGQGQFNNAKSLRKGSKTLQKKLVPIYLTAAELATMFYAAEREFTEFDAEFGDGEEPSAVGGEMKFKTKK